MQERAEGEEEEAGDESLLGVAWGVPSAFGRVRSDGNAHGSEAGQERATGAEGAVGRGAAEVPVQAGSGDRPERGVPGRAGAFGSKAGRVVGRLAQESQGVEECESEREVGEVFGQGVRGVGGGSFRRRMRRPLL